MTGRLKKTNNNSMTKVTIYHNPRCSKSRASLALLEQNNVEIEVIKYLQQPPDIETLSDILQKLGKSPRELMRKQENDYKDNGFANPDLSDAKLLSMMVQFPKVIERPIVVANGQARIGRPPETILEII